MLSQLANVLVVLATLAMGISNAAPSSYRFVDHPKQRFLTSMRSSTLTQTASDKLPSNQPLILALPVGQGDSTLVVCPETDGRVVMVDAGSRQRGWSATDVATFLHGSTLNGKRTLMERLTTIILTHPDIDHYNYVPTVFPAKKADFRADRLKTPFTLPASVMSPSQQSQRRWKDPSDLTVYLSRDASLYRYAKMTEWLAGVKTEQFNNGAECFMEECYEGNSFTEQLCGPSSSVRFQVLAANMGPHRNKNQQSVVVRLSYKGTSALLVGDFEGTTTQKRLVQKVKQSETGSLRADIYKISHHGASRLANKPVFLEAIKPKMAFVSSAYPTEQYGHPMCKVLTSLQKLGSLSQAAQGKHALDCTVKKGQIEHLQPGEAIYATAPNSKEICMIVTALTGGGKIAASPPVRLFCWLFKHHKGEAGRRSAFDLRQDQVATQQGNALVEMYRRAMDLDLYD